MSKTTIYIVAGLLIVAAAIGGAAYMKNQFKENGKDTAGATLYTKA
jgi:hypothetical protein